MRKICFPYKRMISMLLVLICMLGLLPTAALAADAPSSIKMEDCTASTMSLPAWGPAGSIR